MAYLYLLMSIISSCSISKLLLASTSSINRLPSLTCYHSLDLPRGLQIGVHGNSICRLTKNDILESLWTD